MAAAPVGTGPEKFVEFGDGDVIVSLAVVGVGEVLANGRLVGRQLFRGVQLGDGFGKVVLLSQQSSQAAVGLPKLRIQMQRLAKIGYGRFVRGLILLRHSHFVINVGIPRIAYQRFLKRVQGCGILFIGVMPQTQHAIGFGILKIHAQGGAGFGDGIVAVVTVVKHQGQPVVDFGEIRLGVFGTAVLVERGVPITCLLLDVSEGEMHCSVVRILGQQIAEKFGRGIIFLFVSQRRCFHQ